MKLVPSIEAACSGGKDSQGNLADRFGLFELGCDVAKGGKLGLYRRPLPRLNKERGRLVRPAARADHRSCRRTGR